MTVLDIFARPSRARLPGVSAPFALLAGAVLAAGLIWLAQGTAPTPDAPDWRGNAGTPMLGAQQD